ncbi:hypothetical protein ACFSSC_11680 [Corynebacterium mendelii]|uniref:Uncharacterized protein n=1 Tax=Corynebacterium mendelii TaxID=2765362 RepID=A0A939E1N4_9CORY|nr:hypothetical protein [Corynebacterium mendelii]MBN9645339.1 hypothetical protein [Corynebacterium mendelii]
MDINAIMAPVIDFFQHGIGRLIGAILEAIYQLAYPANAEAAHNTPATGMTDTARGVVLDVTENAPAAADSR